MPTAATSAQKSPSSFPWSLFVLIATAVHRSSSSLGRTYGTAIPELSNTPQGRDLPPTPEEEAAAEAAADAAAAQMAVISSRFQAATRCLLGVYSFTM